MENLKVLFLGTGNAVPTKERNHTSILVSFQNENILVDCGEGTQRQFRFAEVSPAKLTRLLITHWHGDHVLGIPGLLQTLSMIGYSKQLKVYGPRGTANNLSLLSEVFKDFKVQMDVKEISSDKIETRDLIIQSLPMRHGIPTLGYSISIKDRIRLDKSKLKKLKLPNSPLLGEIQKGKDVVINGKKVSSKSLTYLEKGKKITIILDTGMAPNAIELAKDSDVLIIESTFSSGEKEQAVEYLHLTAEDAATIAKKANVSRLILTHVSQRYEHKLKIIEKEAKKIFKNTSIVKDLDAIII